MFVITCADIRWPLGADSYYSEILCVWWYVGFWASSQSLQKVTISFLSVCPSVCLSVRQSVCLSVRMEQLGPHWTDFQEIWYSSIFRKSVEEIQVLLKSDKNNV